jgi:DNA-binding winged helix-turn-helix (wHTH) protein
MLLAFGAFELDLKRRTLSCGGRRLGILSRQFDILVFLIQSRDRVVSREDMQTQIWRGRIVTANNLTVQISLLRRMLARHGAGEVIITVPGRGYRFIGEVVERDDRPPAPGDEPIFEPHTGCVAERPVVLVGTRSIALAVAGLAAAVVAAAAILSRPYRESFPALVQVETVPDTVVMVPGGYCKVDYVFRVLGATDLQLATEDARFGLTSGEAIGRPSLGGRIYHGSFPIQGYGTGIYHNNIWLPPDVAAAAHGFNRDELYLRHIFHLMEPRGAEITVPAVLKIVVGAASSACTVPAGR